jgi:hypothetical protein
MPHVVRSSERATRRRCKRAWDLASRQGWSPIVNAQALEFGTAIHCGFQEIYDPALWDEDTDSQKLLRATDAFIASCDAQCEEYLRVTGQKARINWEGRDDYLARKELGRRMLEYYVYHVHADADVNLRPVRVEIKFEVPILDERGKCLQCWNSPACGQIHENPADVLHEGRVDALMEDTKKGGYWALDWKTVGGDKAVDGVEKNTGRFSDPALVWVHDQLCTYCWALRYVLKIDVRGFILAEIRKDWPKPPPAVQRPAGSFSRNKNLSTTLAVYKAHVIEHDHLGYAQGHYDEYLEYLASKNAPRFHERFVQPKTDAELKAVGENLVHEIRAMLRPDTEIYAEAGPFSCRWCAFKSPCEMMMRGMDYQYTLKSQFQQQLRGASNAIIQ